MTEVSFCIDWLRYTAHWGFRNLPSNPSAHSAARIGRIVFPFSTDWKEAKPRNGYTAAIESVAYKNVVVMWSPERADMGVSVDLPGSALGLLDVWMLIDHVVDNDYSVSRIDLAIDVPERWEGVILARLLQIGWVTTAAKKWQHITGTTGWTVYVGSRTSERFLRVYDKGAQMGTDDAWTRVELECKGDYARGITKYLCQEGASGAGNIIKDFADFENYTPWRLAMACPTPFTGIPKVEKQTDTQAWLLNTVAPSLVKALEGDRSFEKKWIDRMEALLGGVGQADVDIFDGKGDFVLD